jgi:hypothetical protein
VLTLLAIAPGFARVVYHCKVDGQAHAECCCKPDTPPPPAESATVATAGCCDVKIVSTPIPQPQAQSQPVNAIAGPPAVAICAVVLPPALFIAPLALDSAPAIRPSIILTKHSFLI